MKKILFSIAGCLIAFFSLAQTNSPGFASVKKWAGTCTVTITDSLPGDVTQYVFTGPVSLVDEVNDGHNYIWPRLSVPASGTNASPQDLMHIAKEMEERSLVWNADITARRRVLTFNGKVQTNDYTCTSSSKEQLKFSLTITGDSISIDPGVEYSGFVNCAGTANDKTVDAQQFLSLNNGNCTVNYQLTPDKTDYTQLKGTYSRRVNNSWIVIEWDLTADMAND